MVLTMSWCHYHRHSDGSIYILWTNLSICGVSINLNKNIEKYGLLDWMIGVLTQSLFLFYLKLSTRLSMYRVTMLKVQQWSVVLQQLWVRWDDYGDGTTEPTASAELGGPAFAVATHVWQGWGQPENARARRVRTTPKPAASNARRPARLDIGGQYSWLNMLYNVALFIYKVHMWRSDILRLSYD